jgi:Domain of unknown function (DUF4351)
LPNGRSEAVKLLGNLQTELNLKKTKSKEEEEAMVKLHPAFVEQLEQAESLGRSEGEGRMLLGLIQKKLGDLPEEVKTAIMSLNSMGLEALSNVFLELSSVESLQQWLVGVDRALQKSYVLDQLSGSYSRQANISR